MGSSALIYADKIISVCEELKALLSDGGAFDNYELLGRLQRLSMGLLDEIESPDAVERYRARREARLSREDEEAEDLDWITLENGVHVPLKDGEAVGGPIKGRDFGDADSSSDIMRNLGEKVFHALRSKKDEAIFFSGCGARNVGGNVSRGSAAVANEYARNNNGVTMNMLIESNMADLPEWDFGDVDSISSWTDASKAYAEQASGDVRVIARPPLREGNVFENVELPTLKKNRRVTSITMINPDTGEKNVIYRRGKKK